MLATTRFIRCCATTQLSRLISADRASLQVAGFRFFPALNEKQKHLFGIFYAVLFAPQFGQAVSVCGIRAPQYLQGIMTTSRTISFSLITGAALGAVTCIVIIELVTSGLFSTAITALVVHVVFESMLVKVGLAPAGMFMLH